MLHKMRKKHVVFYIGIETTTDLTNVRKTVMNSLHWKDETQKVIAKEGCLKSAK